MQSSPKSAEIARASAREHGLDGYTDEAVGGFGESYAAQVAHGGEGDEPGIPSHSEHATNAPSEEDRELALAVQKSLGRAHIDAADMTVDVHGSVVRLRGTVHHLYEKTELEARARAVAGVDSVVSELSVISNGRG